MQPLQLPLCCSSHAACLLKHHTGKIKRAVITVPFKVVLRPMQQKGVALHSFVMGRNGNDILFVGGRINGFHGTDGTNPGINFPTSKSNDRFIVYNISTFQSWSAPLPQKYLWASAQYKHAGMPGWRYIICLRRIWRRYNGRWIYHVF